MGSEIEPASIARALCGDRELAQQDDGFFGHSISTRLVQFDRILRPLCDMVHQMFGREQSPNFTAFAEKQFAQPVPQAGNTQIEPQKPKPPAGEQPARGERPAQLTISRLAKRPPPIRRRRRQKFRRK
jgi:hypothetical protein